MESQQRKERALRAMVFGVSFFLAWLIFRTLLITFTPLSANSIVVTFLGATLGAGVPHYLTNWWFPDTFKRDGRLE